MGPTPAAPTPVPKTGPGKAAKLKSLFRAAKKKQAKLEALAKGGDTGAKLAAAFDSALARAGGEKKSEAVLDDPALIAKSLKRLHAERVRSAKAWAARKSVEKTAMSEKVAATNANRDKKKQRAGGKQPPVSRKGFEGGGGGV